MKIKIYVDDNGEYRWKIVAKNNEILADSGEGYKNEEDLMHALTLIGDLFENTYWENEIVKNS